MAADINIKKDLLQKLVSLWSSVIDKTTGTGNEWFIRTGATITIGDVTSNSQNLATQTTALSIASLLTDIKAELVAINAILTDVHDGTAHTLKTTVVP